MTDTSSTNEWKREQLLKEFRSITTLLKLITTLNNGRPTFSFGNGPVQDRRALRVSRNNRGISSSTLNAVTSILVRNFEVVAATMRLPSVEEPSTEIGIVSVDGDRGDLTSFSEVHPDDFTPHDIMEVDAVMLGGFAAFANPDDKDKDWYPDVEKGKLSLVDLAGASCWNHISTLNCDQIPKAIT